MAPSLGDGVPGLEGQFTFLPNDTSSSFGGLVLNQWMDPSTGLTYTWEAAAGVYTRLQKITGIHDKPDSDDPRFNLNYQFGELPQPRFQRGKTVTFSGTVYGQTLSDMRGYIAEVRALCCSWQIAPSPSTPDWTVTAAYDSTYDPTGLVFTAYGVPIAFTCDEQQGSGDLVPTPYQRPFDLSFRMSDPRWWVTSAPASVGFTGDTFSGIASGTAAALTVDGTAPSEPVFTVHGTGSGSSTITLESVDLGVSVVVDLSGALASGDTLVVNFINRTVTYTPSGGGAEDRTGRINWASTTWWGQNTDGSLLVGTNNLKVTGDEWACAATPCVW